jgi:hypothetical protein
MSLARDLWLARRARAHGARYSLRIIWEARRAGLPISLAFALVEQESAFRNVFGHDRGGMFPGQNVTRSRVRALLRHTAAGGTSNGVGLTQLTWPPLIRAAEKAGGAHTPKAQLRVAFAHLAELIRVHGRPDGIRRYNGSGPAAHAYSTSVRRKADRWHQILTRR